MSKLLEKKSILLLGARQTGKSTFVQQVLPEALYVNLAEADTYRELSTNPELIRQRLKGNEKFIIIDEAQRLPEIFNEVQVMIDRNKALRFVMTGSSARKLKRGNVNLLPGRVWHRHLFPLISNELGSSRIEERGVKGSLPGIIDSEDYKEELKQYVAIYLAEEIRAEALVRGVGNFSRFLTVAALTNTEQLNFTNISNDTGIHLNTVRSFYEILEDTLIGQQLLPFRKTKSRKAVATPKFYFFDSGVVNALLDRFDISPKSELFGKAVEHLMFQELSAYLSYRASDIPLSYWRTHSKLEVDFLLGDEVAIEVKSKTRTTTSDEKGLHALSQELKLRRKIIVCYERVRRLTDMGTEILPIDEFLSELWNDEIIKV